MEDALMVLCWLSIAGPLLDSCRQVCRQSAGGGPLMEGILGIGPTRYTVTMED